MNSLGIELNLLPAGRFTMGQDRDPKTVDPDVDAGADENDETPHLVTLTKPFFLGVHAVTNAQWNRLMHGFELPSKWEDDDRPVEQVSWRDAVHFCRTLSGLPEEQRSGRVYRLPTEAEWEYACRAGSTTRFSFGDDESELEEYAWFSRNSGDQTHPVGQKKPNAWGLFDMHGNVSEWCHDWYGDYGSDPVIDPQGQFRSPSCGPTATTEMFPTPEMTLAASKVHRGGNWSCSADWCRSAFRNASPSGRFTSVGFRLALSPPEAGS